MSTKNKRRTVVKNGDSGADTILATTIRNGEDVAPTVRHSFEFGKPETLLHRLKNIVKKKEVEIEDLCKLHYEEFILAVDELRGVLVDADELKIELSDQNLQLQDVASSLLLKVEEVLQLYSIKKNITEALQTLKICVQLLNLCAKCNLHISEGNFHPALKTIDLIESSYLQNVPMKALRKVIETQMPNIKSYIEKKVCHEFNDWLVHIRSSAKEIGQLAMKDAASSRQRDLEMRKQQREAEERYGECMYMLNIVDCPEERSFLKFDLTPVYRAHHIYVCLGIQERFHKYYYENRLMQLNLDLEISSTQPLLESHQSLFAQIAGYFIVEERVLRTGGGLLMYSQLETLWEGAITKLTSVLEQQISCMETANQLLVIKDSITLLGVTLKQYGYNVDPLVCVLDKSKDRYYELLLHGLQERVADVLADDTYEQMVIKNEGEYEMNVLAFNLHTSDIMPPFPYIAPFSAAVPEACRLVISFIEDSASFLSGSQVNSYSIVKKNLDKFLVEVLNEALLKLIHGRTLGVSQVMQITANIAVLEHACDHFLFQAAHLCGLPPVRLVDVGLSARAALRDSQNAAYVALSRLVNTKVDEFMALTSNINWIPEEAPQSENECVNEVIIYLDTVLSTAQQILPLEALYKLGRGALEHISISIVMAFLSEDVKRFNVNAVMGIDNDLKLLESFADERFHRSGMSDLEKEDNLRGSLIEARQLINLLLSSQPENFMNPVIRVKNYGALDYKKVASICEKFKDSPDRLFGSLSNRNSKQNARKKSMDMLKRRLRDFS
ncbi:hypothetical protein Taro_024285 [Colocasia esculenta]|uniref:Exocyst complex component n=1 Tax=Colocasia esculenta TaxID=4460 RepID=A0A843VJX0_COLES|nr:hypothetical protein [Colocasia esculenta]